MSLIRNERTKLLTDALDLASTACVVTGLIAPASAFFPHANAASEFSFGSSLGIVIWSPPRSYYICWREEPLEP